MSVTDSFSIALIPYLVLTGLNVESKLHFNGTYVLMTLFHISFVILRLFIYTITYCNSLNYFELTIYYNFILHDFFLYLNFNGMARLQFTKIIDGYLRNNEIK